MTREELHYHSSSRNQLKIIILESLPSDDAIDDGLLFAGSAAQVDAGGFYTLVSHKVCEEGYVVEFLEEVLGVSVTERVRVNNFGVKTILLGIFLQLLGNTACRDAFAEAVQEQIAAGP